MSAPTPSRRALLRGAAAGGALVAVGLLTTGCAADDGPDELEAARTRALADAASMSAVIQAFGELAARLVPVAATRREHAAVIEQEIRRARPDRADALDSAPPPRAAAPPDSAPAALGAVRDALTAARDEARALALRAEPYRCGLMASVAGACAAHAEGLA